MAGSNSNMYSKQKYKQASDSMKLVLDHLLIGIQSTRCNNNFNLKFRHLSLKTVWWYYEATISFVLKIIQQYLLEPKNTGLKLFVKKLNDSKLDNGN